MAQSGHSAIGCGTAFTYRHLWLQLKITTLELYWLQLYSDYDSSGELYYNRIDLIRLVIEWSTCSYFLSQTSASFPSFQTWLHQDFNSDRQNRSLVWWPLGRAAPLHWSQRFTQKALKQRSPPFQSNPFQCTLPPIINFSRQTPWKQDLIRQIYF